MCGGHPGKVCRCGILSKRRISVLCLVVPEIIRRTVQCDKNGSLGDDRPSTDGLIGMVYAILVSIFFHVCNPHRFEE